MSVAFHVSDLHGRTARYRALWERIAAETPAAVFLGGDLLPHGMDLSWSEGEVTGTFVNAFLAPGFRELRDRLGAAYPHVFLILGNDDPHAAEADVIEGQREELWRYVHGRRVPWGGREVCGYNCIPPSPFLLKDWERYDVSRYVDPGCVSPEEGRRSDDRSARDVRWTTIRDDLAELATGADAANLVCLFHAPPYDSALDLADIAGKMVDHVPVDPHIGSIAVREFLQDVQPLVSLHGHVHESARLTGAWRQGYGRSVALSAAHDGPELCLVRFDPDDPRSATRELV